MNTIDIDLYEQLKSVATRRQSVRGFDKGRDVPQHYIEKMIDIARTAPSAANAQPWEFVIVRDKDMRQQFAKLYMKQHEEKREMEKAVRSQVRMTGPGFQHAPVHIVVVGDPRSKESLPIRTALEKADKHLTTGLSNATMLLHLAAASLGLASQYVSDASSPYMSTMIKHWLHIPQSYVVYELIPVGYALKYPQPTPRRALEEIIHWDCFDPAKFRNEEQYQQFLVNQTRVGAYGKAFQEASADEVGLMLDETDAKQRLKQLEE